MTIYADVFGGANIYPSDVTYRAVTLSGEVTLNWPEETSATGNYVARIMDVASTGVNDTFIMPDARGSGTGNTVLFNNTGSNTFLVKDAFSSLIVSIAPGTAWQVYLTSNTTLPGAWEVFQYGAGVSSANAASLAGTGIVAVGSLLSQSVPITTFNTNYASGTTDRAKMYVWTGGSGTLWLPDPVSVGNNWFLMVRNAGSGSLTVDPITTALIDGTTNKAYQPGESSIVVTDGTAYYTLGYGSSAVFNFDFVSIDVSGSGDYALTGAELNRIAYKFTGTLTGNRNVIVPATVQQYWVSNQTSGAYTFTVKLAASPGEVIAQNETAIGYSDGTDFILANTSPIALPLAVASGGTGSGSAAGARINLGATTIGDGVFTAASPAAAWVALGEDFTIDGGTF